MRTYKAIKKKPKIGDVVEVMMPKGRQIIGKAKIVSIISNKLISGILIRKIRNKYFCKDCERIFTKELEPVLIQSKIPMCKCGSENLIAIFGWNNDKFRKYYKEKLKCI